MMQNIIPQTLSPNVNDLNLFRFIAIDFEKLKSNSFISTIIFACIDHVGENIMLINEVRKIISIID